MRDLQRQYQEFKAGNYASVADYFQGLVKQIPFSVAIKRNVLIMEALVDQGRENGIEEMNLEFPKDMSQVTAFSAREQYFKQLFEDYAKFQKAIDFMKGYVGHKASDSLCIISVDSLYSPSHLAFLCLEVLHFVF